MTDLKKLLLAFSGQSPFDGLRPEKDTKKETDIMPIADAVQELPTLYYVVFIGSAVLIVMIISQPIREHYLEPAIRRIKSFLQDASGRGAVR